MLSLTPQELTLVGIEPDGEAIGAFVFETADGERIRFEADGDGSIGVVDRID